MIHLTLLKAIVVYYMFGWLLFINMAFDGCFDFAWYVIIDACFVVCGWPVIVYYTLRGWWRNRR